MVKKQVMLYDSLELQKKLKFVCYVFFYFSALVLLCRLMCSFVLLCFVIV